jgi:oligogalacturonide transport system permease protein
MKLSARLHILVSYALLILFGYIMIYPLLFMLFASFKTNQEIFGSIRLLPREWVFGAYARGWRGSGQFSFSVFLANTFKLVIPTIGFTLVSSTLVGYGFARFKFPLKKVFFLLMISTLMLPNTVIIIPRYIFFKNLGWLDS